MPDYEMKPNLLGDGFTIRETDPVGVTSAASYTPPTSGDPELDELLTQFAALLGKADFSNRVEHLELLKAIAAVPAGWRRRRTARKLRKAISATEQKIAAKTALDHAWKARNARVAGGHTQREQSKLSAQWHKAHGAKQQADMKQNQALRDLRMATGR